MRIRGIASLCSWIKIILLKRSTYPILIAKRERVPSLTYSLNYGAYTSYCATFLRFNAESIASILRYKDYSPKHLKRLEELSLVLVKYDFDIVKRKAKCFSTTLSQTQEHSCDRNPVQFRFKSKVHFINV